MTAESAFRLAAALLLLTACRSIGPSPVEPDPAGAAYASGGSFAVDVLRDEWFDAGRNRHVPVKMYVPRGSGPFPVVIFSHGLGNSDDGYEYLGRHWASHGMISVHPEHSGAARDLAGQGLIALYRAGFDRRLWITIPGDVSFVIDGLQRFGPLAGRVDRAHVAVAGHSLGAYAALAVAGAKVPAGPGGERSFRDPRVLAAIPLSMSEELPRSAYRDIRIPLLHMSGTSDSSLFYGTTRADRRVPFESILGAQQILVTIRGANHSTFSDADTPSNAWQHDIIRAATTAFLDAWLKDDAGARAWLEQGLARFADGGARVETKR
jgi:predicted dienelactone hydrolase